MIKEKCDGEGEGWREEEAIGVEHQPLYEGKSKTTTRWLIRPVGFRMTSLLKEMAGVGKSF
jgi:hypothetical protein